MYHFITTNGYKLIQSWTDLEVERMVAGALPQHCLELERERDDGYAVLCYRDNRLVCDAGGMTSQPWGGDRHYLAGVDYACGIVD